MKRYPAYKDSGNDWIDLIPSNWEIKKLKHVIDFQEGLGLLANEFLDEGIPLIRISGIKNQVATLEGCNYVAKEKVQNQWKSHQLKLDDILISCSASTDLVSEIKDDLEGCVAYTGIIRLRPKNNASRKDFIKYFVSSIFYQIQIDIQKTGSTIQHYGPTHLNKMLFILPPIIEQQAITTFLKYKIQQIDDLIAKKQKIIELLNEERTALINQAVIKGLDPNVPMKDSGNEWLGRIPDRWKVSKIKYCAEINKDVLGDDTPDDFEFKYVDIGMVTFGKINGIPEKLVFKNAPSRARRILHEGDTIISTVRTYLKAVLFIENSLNEFIGSTGFAVLTPTKTLVPRFLYYVMTSQQIIEQICSISVGVSYPATNASDIGNIPIWLPSVPEQEMIVNYIEEKIDSLTYIEKKSMQEIELISEYKTSLINEAVTGKIDVRNYIIKNNHEEVIKN